MLSQNKYFENRVEWVQLGMKKTSISIVCFYFRSQIGEEVRMPAYFKNEKL